MSRTLKKTCKFCGSEFLAERSTAKFCKPAHRIAYNRLPMRIAGMWERALHEIVQITVLTEAHPHLSAHAYDAHKILAAQVKHQQKKLQKTYEKLADGE